MTPLQIEMLLHYYSRADDYRDGDFSAPAVREALEGFKRDELLAADQADPPRTCYVITERGRVYVEALRRVCPQCQAAAARLVGCGDGQTYVVG